MTLQSPMQRYEAIQAAALSLYEPADTYYAWAARNNLGHLIDEFTQTRISWCASTRPADLLITTDDEAHAVVWSQLFFHTWLTPTRPANLDVLVTATSGTLVAPPVATSWEVAVRPWSVPFTDPAVLAGVSGTYNFPSSTDKDLLDSQLFFYEGNPAPGNESGGLLGTKGGAPYVPQIMIARLDVRLGVVGVDEVGNAFPVNISRVMVREFA